MLEEKQTTDHLGGDYKNHSSKGGDKRAITARSFFPILMLALRFTFPQKYVKIT